MNTLSDREVRLTCLCKAVEVLLPSAPANIDNYINAANRFYRFVTHEPAESAAGAPVLRPATDELKSRGMKLTSAQFYRKMCDAGLAEMRKHKSLSYPVLIARGLAFGENRVTLPGSPITRPGYFSDRFDELLKIIDL